MEMALNIVMGQVDKLTFFNFINRLTDVYVQILSLQIQFVHGIWAVDQVFSSHSVSFWGLIERLRVAGNFGNFSNEQLTFVYAIHDRY